MGRYGSAEITVRHTQIKTNHVALILDGSGSMGSHKDSLIKVVDGLIKWLADRSVRDGHETRITIYVFDDVIELAMFDRDVMRVQVESIRKHYWTRGGTALIDSVKRAVEDFTALDVLPALYSDHATLLFVLTDGYENASRHRAEDLRIALKGLPDHWTTACMVPNSTGKIEAINFGFPPGNVEIWDTTSRDGAEQAVKKLQTGLDTYLTGRTAGTRSTSNLFEVKAPDVADVAAALKAGTVKIVDPDDMMIIPVAAVGSMKVVIPAKSVTKTKNPNGIPHVEIMEFVEATGRRYEAGKTFYELEKSEKFDGHKQVALIETATNRVIVGRAARELIGLDQYSRRIKPMPVDKATGKPQFRIFCQSTSINRHLRIGSQILLLK